MPEFRVFVSLPIESTKAANFIYILKKKQDVWFEMMTVGTSSQCSYHYLQMAYYPSRFNSRPPFGIHSDAFSCYLAQQGLRPGYSQDVSYNSWNSRSSTTCLSLFGKYSSPRGNNTHPANTNKVKYPCCQLSFQPSFATMYHLLVNYLAQQVAPTPCYPIALPR